jgi:hypothetical protein
VIFQVKYLLSNHASHALPLQCLPIDLVTRLIPPCVFPTEPCIYRPFITSSRLKVKFITARLRGIKRFSHLQSLLSALLTLLNHSLSTSSSSPASTAPSNRPKPAMELIDTQPMNVSEQSSENPSQCVQMNTPVSDYPDSGQSRLGSSDIMPSDRVTEPGSDTQTMAGPQPLQQAEHPQGDEILKQASRTTPLCTRDIPTHC